MSESRTRRWFAIAVTALALSALAATAEAQPFVYVLTKVPGTPWQQYLTVIDPATNTKGPRIPLGRSNGYLLTQAIAMAPDGARIYVVNDYDHSVSVVSTATNTVIDTLPTSLVGSHPWALAVSPDTQTLYVVGNTQVFVAIDVASRTRVATLTHNQGGATGIVASPDGERVYMTAGADPTRLVVFGTAPHRLLASQELPGYLVDASALTLSPNGRFLYVPQRPFNAGSTVTCPPGVDCVSLTPPGSTPPRVLVLDTTTDQFVAQTDVGRWPFHVGVSPNGATVYAADYLPTATHRLHPATHASLGTVTGAPRGFVMAFLPDSSRAYFAGNLTVSVIDTTTHAVTATIPFVASTDGRALGIVTTPPPYVVPDPPSNLRATVTGNRVSLTWDPPTGGPPSAYVMEGGVSPGSVLGSLPVDGGATSFAFDAPTGAFYLRMRSRSSAGRSRASNEVQVFVNVPLAPSAPSGLLGLADGANLALSWTSASAGGAPTSFVVDVSGAITTSVPVPVDETFSYAGVPPGTYTFAVRAMNATGPSPASLPVTLSFPSACPGAPQAPTNFAVSRVGSQLSVTWDPPGAGPAISSYVLKVSGALNLALPMATRSIGGAVPSGTYNLSVLAVNPCGSGAETPEQSVTVP